MVHGRWLMDREHRPRGVDPRGLLLFRPLAINYPLLTIRYFIAAGNRGSFFSEYSTIFVAIFVASSER